MRRQMSSKVVLLVLAFFLCFVPASLAYLFELQILNQDEIHKLSDEALKKAYIETQIEIMADKIFFEKAGFRPPDYAKFKEILRYRVNLLSELQSRKLEIPKTEL